MLATIEERRNRRRRGDKHRQRDHRNRKKVAAKAKLLFPKFRLCPKKMMSQVKSWFALHAHERGREYVLHLDRWEIYMTKLVSRNLHGRHVLDTSGANGTKVKPTARGDGKDWVIIGRSETEYMDNQHDLLHVIRENSTLLDDFLQGGCYSNVYCGKKFIINFSIIVNGMMTKGVCPPKKDYRSRDSYRLTLSFTCGGGKISFGRIQRSLGDNAGPFLREVGKLAEFLCGAMRAIQQKVAKDDTIWWDKIRDLGFAGKLRDLLFLGKDSPMGAEMIGVCVMPLTMGCPRNEEHRDVMNPEQDGYNRSGVFSVVVTDDLGHLYLVQIIAASRRYARTIVDREYIHNDHIRISQS